MTDTVQAQLEAIKSRFQKQLPNRIGDIRSAFERLQPDRLDPTYLAELATLVHRLAGSAGTFGHEALGETAAGLSRRLEALRPEAGIDPFAWDGIARGVAELEHVGFGQLAPVSDLDRHQSLERLLHPEVAIVDDDDTLRGALATLVAAGGYRATAFRDPDSFVAHCQQFGPPDVVLMDLDFPEQGTIAGAESLAAMRSVFDPPPMAVLISKHDDLQSRLAAYRAGASRYLLKPIDSIKVLHVLDQLTARAADHAYRVMLVDDDERLAEINALVLRSAGFEVEALSQPLQLLERLRAFKPDVLLLDVYMPEASGPELAAVLREDESLSWLPILFLSAESDPSKHALALAHGGDDFLTKPVRPAYMIAAVKARAWRARRNRADWEELKRLSNRG